MPQYQLFKQPKIDSEFSYNAFEKEIKEAAVRNEERYRIALDAYKQLLALAAVAYGTNSKQHKYLRNNEIDRPIGPERFLKTVRKRWYAFLEAEAKREYQRDWYQRSKLARYRLSLIGLQPYDDYPYNSAITTEKKMMDELGDKYPTDEEIPDEQRDEESQSPTH